MRPAIILLKFTATHTNCRTNGLCWSIGVNISMIQRSSSPSLFNSHQIGGLKCVVRHLKLDILKFWGKSHSLFEKEMSFSIRWWVRGCNFLYEFSLQLHPRISNSTPLKDKNQNIHVIRYL